MASITLDVVIESTLEETIADIKTGFAGTVTVVKESGPAGGWPEIKFEGDREDVEHFVREWYTNDKEDADYLIEEYLIED